MTVDVRQVVAALEAAVTDQRLNVDELDEGYEAGYIDGLVRALDIVQSKTYGMTTGAEGGVATHISAPD